MQAKKTADAGSGARGKTTELDDRYAKIGISAVAAAVRYQSDNRDPAPAQTSTRHRDE